jgi:hypothetical protein
VNYSTGRFLVYYLLLSPITRCKVENFEEIPVGGFSYTGNNDWTSESPGKGNSNKASTYSLTLKKDGKSLQGTVINPLTSKEIRKLPDNFNKTYTPKKILESCGAGNKALLTYFDETVVKFQKNRLILEGTVAGDIIGGYGSHGDKAEFSLGTPDEVIALRDNITQFNYMGTFYYWDGHNHIPLRI